MERTADLLQHPVGGFVRWIQSFAVIVSFACLARASNGDETTLGIVDTYGLREVTRDAVLAAVGLKVGDVAPTSRKEIVERLEAIPGVKHAAVTIIRVASPTSRGGSTAIAYIGIDEGTRPQVSYRGASTVDVVLPVEIVDIFREYRRALSESQRHGHFNDEAGRPFQEKFASLADQNRDKLVEVLRTSQNAEQRAIAAWIMGQSSDKKQAARELVIATHDPDATVRNNTMRVLGDILDDAQRRRELAIEIPADWYVDLLDSLVWTDRNKAMWVMLGLTQDGDEVLLSKLRERALPNLAEMARWTSEGHALMAFMLLGRVAHMTETETLQAWQQGEREDVIARTSKSESTRK